MWSSASRLAVSVFIAIAVTHAPAYGTLPSSDSDTSEMEAEDSRETAQQSYSEVPHFVQELSIVAGQFSVVGDLILPADGKDHPVIVFVWGSGPAGRENVGRPSALLTTMLESGFGVFVEDKPGTGASTGGFTPGRLLRERGEILATEIAYLRGLPELDESAIGLYGSSQAAYVIGLALDRGARIDFLVAVSCPAVDSVEQSAYLVGQQLLCEEYGRDEAALARRFFIQRHRAKSYSEYLEAAEFLDGIPVISDDLGWGGVVAESQFTPRRVDSENFYDPSDALVDLGVPVLALYAEHDTQVDPEQGAEAFAVATDSSESGLSRVITVPGADHNMRVSETGCLKEQRQRYAEPGGAEYAPGFLKHLRAWLLELGAYLRRPVAGAPPSN